MRLNIVLAVLWVVLTAGVIAAPPPASGTISGQVLGTNRKPVAHARLSLQAADGHLPEITETNAQGRFSFSALRGGYYDLRAVADGRVSEWRQNVLVAPGQQIAIVLHLRPSAPSASGSSLKSNP